MWTIFGKDFTFSKNEQSTYGPNYFVRADQWIKECISKHGKELAVMRQMKLNGRIEMFACVVYPFQRRAHKIKTVRAIELKF